MPMSQELLYLSRTDVEKVALPMAEMIVAMEAVFRDKGEGRTEMPPKFGIHPCGAQKQSPASRGHLLQPVFVM